jgi:hypothetical protein
VSTRKQAGPFAPTPEIAVRSAIAIRWRVTRD